jgi:hypothetical protein
MQLICKVLAREHDLYQKNLLEFILLLVGLLVGIRDVSGSSSHWPSRQSFPWIKYLITKL